MAYLTLGSEARSFELVGDSMLKRLYRFYHGDNSKRNIGFCIGGITMSQLANRLAGRTVNQDVILQIGTNDLLVEGVELDIEKLKLEMNNLIAVVKESGADNITILTLPPIPSCGYRNGVLKIWKAFNKWILSELPSEERNVSVVNTGKIFYSFTKNHFKKDLFNDDMLHWNAQGMDLVLQMLDESL
ncbi:uncharacterized protein LOC108667399 [Hyalella azteca]|uniref:Uncharacterized protein LOC108667399 n=1 Tax=Hyalella azteca TaxID=294128 RepID=A0A8B7N9A9_HYAAZ|nr:uncharacterized protein LOC108667399 [Hyalella azteca]